MSYLVLVLLLGSALAESGDDIVDRLFGTVVGGQPGTKVPQFYTKYPRGVTTANMVFSVRFSDGTMNITKLIRAGDVTVDEEKKMHFKALYEAEASYGYKLTEEGFKATVSSGSATAKWTGTLQGILSTDNCKALLESSTIDPVTKLDVDIKPRTNELYMTVHPPSTYDLVKILSPALQTYLTDNVKDVPVC